MYVCVYGYFKLQLTVSTSGGLLVKCVFVYLPLLILVSLIYIYLFVSICSICKIFFNLIYFLI